MIDKIIYTPFISKSIPVSEYWRTDPDRKVILTQYTPFKPESEVETITEKYPILRSSEPFAFQPITFSGSFFKHQDVDPDKEIIPIQHVPKTTKEPTPKRKETRKAWTPNLKIVKDILKSTSTSNEEAWNEAFEQFGSQFGLKDDAAYMYILGQLDHESGEFRHMEEIASGKAYEGRIDLGNTEKGDGVKYKGRGPIQVTGKNNYKRVYEDFFVPNGLGEYNIVENPELGSDPKIGSLMTIGWFLTTENGKRAIAAANNHDIKALTKAVNGGNNGLSEREIMTKRRLKQIALHN